MTKQNSDNSRRGRDFQELAAEVLSAYWSIPLGLEVPIPIGKPVTDIARLLNFG